MLFSKAELDWILDPVWTKDIDDIIHNGETFSDGCGLMSKRFAVQLSRRKRFVHHGRPYTPCVFQIRSVLLVCAMADYLCGIVV